MDPLRKPLARRRRRLSPATSRTVDAHQNTDLSPVRLLEYHPIHHVRKHQVPRRHRSSSTTSRAVDAINFYFILSLRSPSLQLGLRNIVVVSVRAMPWWALKREVGALFGQINSRL